MTTISLTFAVSSVALAEGRATATASVTNGATVPARIVLGAFPEGSDAGGAAGWTSIDRPLREVAAGATEQFTVTFAPPPTIAAGTYPVRFIAYSADQVPEEYADQARRVDVVVPAAPPPPVPKKPWWPIAAIVAALVVVAAVIVYFVAFRDKTPHPAPSPTMTSSPSSTTPLLSAPRQLSPANGSVFNFFPRTTTLQWSAVPGAASYSVEIDCFNCCALGQWCTQVGKTLQVVPGLTATNYTVNYVGAQPGRWRVWAVSSSGAQSAKTDWWTFTFTQ